MSKAKRSKLMASIKSSGTKPENRLAVALQTQGIRFKRIYGPEKIDIAIPTDKLAIFVDGCFWHQCPKHSHLPKSNKGYWLPKLKANARRAKAKDLRLRKNGWSVVHIWEHSLASETDANAQAQRIIKKFKLKNQMRIK
ncbi:MAG: very short patch repair endonuclease [Candidatus Micrarchaeia archaeon]